MRYSLESCPPTCMVIVRQSPKAKNTISEDRLAAFSFVGLAPTAYRFAGFWLFNASEDPSPCGCKQIPGAVESHLAVHLPWPEESTSYLLAMGPFPQKQS